MKREYPKMQSVPADAKPTEISLKELRRRIDAQDLDGLRGLKWARLRKGLSQVDLAQAIGVNLSTLQNWEICRYWPSSLYLPIIADALNVEIKDLYLGGF